MRLRQAEIHQRHETLAAGENFGLISVRLKKSQRFVDAFRPEQIEWRGFHGESVRPHLLHSPRRRGEDEGGGFERFELFERGGLSLKALAHCLADLLIQLSLRNSTAIRLNSSGCSVWA